MYSTNHPLRRRRIGIFLLLAAVICTVLSVVFVVQMGYSWEYSLPLLVLALFALLPGLHNLRLTISDRHRLPLDL